jgi:hypothetical protein
MVVTGIFMVLSSVVLSANSRFGNLIVLQTLAHDMALSIRQAQVYGISVRRYEAEDFDVSYGVHFELPGAEDSSIYQLFADVNRNGYYDNSDAVITSTTINPGYYISSLCVGETSGSDNCGVSVVDVVFRRPEPDACISEGESTTFTSPKYTCVSQLNRMYLILESRSGEQSKVTVEKSGQISVQ